MRRRRPGMLIVLCVVDTVASTVVAAVAAALTIADRLMHDNTDEVPHLVLHAFGVGRRRHPLPSSGSPRAHATGHIGLAHLAGAMHV